MEKKVKEIIDRARLESTTKSDVFVKELLDLFSVSVSLEGTANKLIEMYEEREITASKNGNWSEAFQNEIRVNVLQHLILLHKHNER